MEEPTPNEKWIGDAANTAVESSYALLACLSVTSIKIKNDRRN